MRDLVPSLAIIFAMVLTVDVFGCAGRTGYAGPSPFPYGSAATREPLTIEQLQRDVEIARDRERRFEEVYNNPDAYSWSDRNLAVWKLPPLVVPKDCIAPGTEKNPECILYAARLHALPFFVSSSLTADTLTAEPVVVSPLATPDGY
jgi:hypothetical protein